MSESRVLVLLPVYSGDNPDWMSESVRSLLDQTVAVDILIGVDGPIPENIRARIEECRRLADGRVEVHHFAENRGLAHTLNGLIAIATRLGEHEFFGRMDADDICYPGRFEQQLHLLDSQPNVGVCGTWCVEFDERGSEFVKRLPTGDAELKRFMTLRAPFVHPSVVFRRSVLMEHQYPVDSPLVEDAAMWLRLAKAGVGFANVGQCLLRYRFSSQMMARRGGWRRGLAEWKLRRATSAALLRKRVVADELLSLCFFALRLSPAWINRFAYRMLR